MIWLKLEVATHNLAGRSYYKSPCLAVYLLKAWERQMLPGQNKQQEEYNYTILL